MDAERRFAELVDALVAESGVTPPVGGRRFGGSALKVDGSIFAMLVRGELVVKLPAARVAALIAEGRGGPFESGRGRAMREWLTVDPDADWPALAAEALAFVRR